MLPYASYCIYTIYIVLPCLSGGVSEGWHDHKARYDDPHLGRTEGEEDIFNIHLDKTGPLSTH